MKCKGVTGQKRIGPYVFACAHLGPGSIKAECDNRQEKIYYPDPEIFTSRCGKLDGISYRAGAFRKLPGLPFQISAASRAKTRRIVRRIFDSRSAIIANYFVQLIKKYLQSAEFLYYKHREKVNQ